MQRYCDRCAQLAEEEEEEEGVPFCAASRSCPRDPQPLLFEEIWLPNLGRGENEVLV